MRWIERNCHEGPLMCLSGLPAADCAGAKMLVCSGEESEGAQPDGSVPQPLVKHKEARKKYQWNHGSE